MKKLCTLLLSIIAFTTITKAQTINIPDANFKAALIAQGVDTSGDGEIQQSEALALTALYLGGLDIISAEGIEYFTNTTIFNCFQTGIKQLDLSSLTQLQSIDCMMNDSLTTINLSNLTQVTHIDCSLNNLTSFDVSDLTAVEYLDFGTNHVNSIDLSNNTNVTRLICFRNNLTELDLSNMPLLEMIQCFENNLTTLDVSNNTNLEHLWCSDNNLSMLDLSHQSYFRYLRCIDNPLVYINLNNGISNDTLVYAYQIFSNVPNLEHICCDAEEVDILKQEAIAYGYANVTINTICDYNLGGAFYALHGNITLDNNNNGCDDNDSMFINAKIKISNGIDSGFILADENGDFAMSFNEGTYTLTPILENPEYYTISPSTTTITLPEDTIPQSFCVTPINNFNDLKINIIPTTPARPGFLNTYILIYRNQGTTTQSATVAFNYNEDKMDFITASLTPNSTTDGVVSFNINNLSPLAQGSIIINMRINSPADNPAVNAGDTISVTAKISNADNTDERPFDNFAILRQTVVGSYDPNDKTCLEGDIVTPDLIGKPVNYLIRFENTGTANAENIVITDYIDLNTFDINSLQIVDASHSCRTVISNGNKVQFVFDNIQLPFTEPDKHGFVAFSINLLPNLQIGDSLKNDADIYFDFNLPITTNLAVSEINNSTPTAIKTNNTIAGNLNLFPNPNKGQFTLNLDAKGSFPIHINIYDASGKAVYSNQYYHNNQSIIPININNLANGIYVVKANYQNNIWSQQMTIVK
ncbi:MAG: T9SS type A sorting domain-containing protein [Chitinophagales bacterium]